MFSMLATTIKTKANISTLLLKGRDCRLLTIWKDQGIQSIIQKCYNIHKAHQLVGRHPSLRNSKQCCETYTVLGSASSMALVKWKKQPTAGAEVRHVFKPQIIVLLSKKLTRLEPGMISFSSTVLGNRYLTNHRNRFGCLNTLFVSNPFSH